MLAVLFYEFYFVVIHCRNVIPSTSCFDPASSCVARMLLDDSSRVSAGVVMPPHPGADDVASDSVKTVTTDAENVSIAERSSLTKFCCESVGAGNVSEKKRGSPKKALSPKARVRRTQLKMLADNLSNFYAPLAGGKRRELLAQRRMSMETQCSARERQLQVIRKQVSLVEKRKKAELENAEAMTTSVDKVSEPKSRGQSVHSTGAANADTVSRRTYTTALYNPRISRKVESRWKIKRGKYRMQHRQKSSRVSACHSEAELSLSSPGVWFAQFLMK